MADVQTRVQMPNDAVGPTKAAESQITSVAASAGVAAEPVLVEGRLGAPKINARVTGEPVLGPAQFFPANPTMAKELAESKPVKQMSDGDRTSSGGILRTISDVITELRSKHQNRKRDRVQGANSGSPSQAKFRKEAEESIDLSKAKAVTTKADASVGSPKEAGSDDKVSRMTCFGTSDRPIPEKKPSLAQRYSAWKVKQAERRAARGAVPVAAPGTKGPETVVVSEKATAAEAEKVATTQGA